METNQQIIILQLLIKNELLVKELYLIFAKIFPEYGEFWAQLAKEEQDHAQALTMLTKQWQENKVLFNQDRYKADTIQFSIDYKKKIIQEAQMPGYTYIRAVSAANTLEQALLESKFFEIFSGDSEEFKRVAN